LLPLREPETLVFLKDPVLNELIYPGEIITDLFFSGHTALVFMLFILSGYRWYFLLLTLLMGVFLMIQRIHYSIDVLAALPFAWLAVWLSGKFLERISKSNNT
jgi:membrane-associated phospholipid phosphatase